MAQNKPQGSAAQEFNELIAEIARRQVLAIFKAGRPPRKEKKFKGGYNVKVRS